MLAFALSCLKLKSTRNFPLHNCLQSKSKSRNKMRKTCSLLSLSFVVGKVNAFVPFRQGKPRKYHSMPQICHNLLSLGAKSGNLSISAAAPDLRTVSSASPPQSLSQYRSGVLAADIGRGSSEYRSWFERISVVVRPYHDRCTVAIAPFSGRKNDGYALLKRMLH